MKNKKDIIIKIILIIIIILLLIHNCNLIKTLKDKKTPTGNVDIFEISCDKDTCEEEVKTKKDNTDINSDDTSKEITTNQNTKNNKNIISSDDKVDTNFTISDNYITWKSNNELRIFDNPVYDMEPKIAPGDNNIYQFVIKNNTNNNIKYNITFNETNNYGLNMKYKLKKGNTYLTGDDYVNYNELNQNNILINKGTSTTYYLEWKWIGTDNDNNLSGIKNAYKLNLEIEAESE